MKIIQKRYFRFLVLSLLLTALFVIAVLGKFIKINPIIAAAYPIHGVDVSHYQGEIDWKAMESQNIKFAFIKATEGSGMVDENFLHNWRNVKETSVISGAYHFFSFDSPSKTQASLFIKTVGDLGGRLPPVVDVEYYSDKYKNPPSKEDLVKSLKSFIRILEDNYGVKPIIYTTYSFYDEYIAKDFDDYPLWLRNVYYKPHSFFGKKWIFWQYSDTEKLQGYYGEEEYIDKNVFYGTKDELETYIIGH